jgi:hypothetical protein
MKQNKMQPLSFLLEQKALLLTKEQVAARGLLNSPPYSYAAKVFIALNKDGPEIYVPHSDVYYVRAAVESRTGYYFPLDVVEQAMILGGWRDRKSKWRY